MWLTLYFYWPSLAWTLYQQQPLEPPLSVDHTLFLKGTKAPNFFTSVSLLMLFHFSCSDCPYSHAEILSLFEAYLKCNHLWEYFQCPFLDFLWHFIERFQFGMSILGLTNPWHPCCYCHLLCPWQTLLINSRVQPVILMRILSIAFQAITSKRSEQRCGLEH